MDKQGLKQQRDRFLAFSFASADLFLEVSGDGEVVFALGAARSLTGINDKTLLGQKWLAIFSPKDRKLLDMMRTRANPAERGGPYIVTLDETLGQGLKAIVTGIRMPGSDSFYLTLGFSNALMAQVATAAKEMQESKLLDKDDFMATARDAIDTARSVGQDLDMTLLDIENLGEVRKKMGEDWWNGFTQTITEYLCAQSADGRTAATIKDGRYSVIHDKSVSSEDLRVQLTELAKTADPAANVEITSKTIESDLQTLSEREASKALIYTINEFERKGTSLNIETLNTGFKAYVTANAHKISQFKSMIEQLNFDFHFQPIVDLETYEVSHYEMLSRFKGEGSTQEWIIFGEDIGMAPDFDIAVCERAINYLVYKSAGRRTRFAVNLSGQSVQNEQFCKTLLAKLDLNKNLSDRLIFEITESTAINDLDKVNNFIGILQERGFKVCMDDFGAGAASFQYLQKLDVDYLKIDGQYARKLLTNQRDAVMVRNLVKMCKDLDITTIIEKIETEPQARMVREMGIPLAQGFLFSTPRAKPDYDPAEAKANIKAQAAAVA